MLTPLKTYRQRKGLTGRKVALDLCITPSHYRRIEIGEVSASPETANKIAKYFDNGVTRDQILFPEDYPESNQPSPPNPSLKKAS